MKRHHIAKLWFGPRLNNVGGVQMSTTLDCDYHMSQQRWWGADVHHSRRSPCALEAICSMRIDVTINAEFVVSFTLDCYLRLCQRIEISRWKTIHNEVTRDAGRSKIVSSFSNCWKLATHNSLPGTGLLLTGLTKCRTSAGNDVTTTAQSKTWFTVRTKKSQLQCTGRRWSWVWLHCLHKYRTFINFIILATQPDVRPERHRNGCRLFINFTRTTKLHVAHSAPHAATLL